MSLFTWGVVFVLILVNAVYVAAEFAAVGAPRARLRQRADEGDARASRLLAILLDPRKLDRYIAASQIGITLSSLVLGAFSEMTLGVALADFLSGVGVETARAHSVAAIVVLVGLTIVQMVLGELVPKALALQHPTRVALWTVGLMRWSLSAMRVSIAFLNRSSYALLRLLGLRPAEGQHVHSPQEIELLLAESRAGGLLEAHEHRRLRQALNLGNRPARDLMVPRDRIQAIELHSSPKEVQRAVAESPFTRLPVYQGSMDRIVGLVHTRDVVLAQPLDGESFELRNLVRPVLFIPGDLPADRLLARMREARRQLAVVCDQFGATLGMVSVDDILDALLGEMADDLKDAAGRETRRA